jgi:hypothetical protein
MAFEPAGTEELSVASRTALRVAFAVALTCGAGQAQDSDRVREATGVDAGLAVHIGTTDGGLEVGLAANRAVLGRVYVSTVDGKLFCLGAR